MTVALIVLLVVILFFMPAIVAFLRSHHYRWIILLLNAFGFTGVCWLIAMGWAVWPSEKSLADPILGNVTGLGSRNAGDVLGAMDLGRGRGLDQEARMVSGSIPTSDLARLEKLASLKAAGTLTDEEFTVQKALLLKS
jgi:hypothetical protein